MDEDGHIKIILLGNTGVGKTSIINKFGNNSFDENQFTTPSPNFIRKSLKINNEIVKVQLWDTAGQEKYNSVSKLFTKNAKIIILVYDVTRIESFKGLNYWYDFIKNDLDKNVIIGLAGNKVDKLYEDEFDEEVTSEEAKKCAENWGVDFALLSAKCDQKGIDVFFEQLIKKYLEMYSIPKNERKTIAISNDTFEKKVEQKTICCS